MGNVEGRTRMAVTLGTFFNPKSREWDQSQVKGADLLSAPDLCRGLCSHTPLAGNHTWVSQCAPYFPVKETSACKFRLYFKQNMRL